MKWRKLGVIWKPDGTRTWAFSHASCPTPLALSHDVVRLYVQCRDAAGIGRVGYVDVKLNSHFDVIRVGKRPVLDIGAPGTFDDNGVFQTSVVELANGQLYMYYVGFEICTRIRYRLLTGLAISSDGGETFQKLSPTPVLERSASELFFRGGAYVLNDAGRYRMWYVAGDNWVELNGKSMPVYDIRYAESEDGIHWPENGRVVLPLTDEDEHGFGRPYVMRDAENYRMFYSIRRKSLGQYRIGYAESSDGLTWTRKDGEVGLDVSPAGWDSESVEYPAVMKAGANVLMFYNGNDFGATGVGVAVLE